MTAEVRSLHRKLAQIMYEAERIPKRGKAPKEMGGYPFVQVGDAADFIRKALAEKVLTMMPTAVQVVGQQDRPTAKGGSMTTVDLITDWTITDGESGESITIQSFGAGADVGDKYSGKASTSAMKYALLTTFLLSTGEDSELGTAQHTTTRVLSAADAPKDETNGGGLIGTAVAQGTQDFELRESPDGWTLPFRVKDKGGSQIVVAHDGLAQTLRAFRDEILGERVTVWGSIQLLSFPKGNSTVEYKVLQLERIVSPAGTFSAGMAASEPPAKGQVAAFDDAEQSVIDAALEKAGTAA